MRTMTGQADIAKERPSGQTLVGNLLDPSVFQVRVTSAQMVKRMTKGRKDAPKRASLSIP